MQFTQKETKDLIYAGIMISLAFAILLVGGFQGLLSYNYLILISFIVAFFTAGVGFLLHELMHKYVAQKYGLKAEFQAYYSGLWFALILSLFGFIIAAPGAVYISGFITKERNGKISLAGPATNLFLGIIFLLFLLLTNLNHYQGGLLELFLRYGFNINAILALFNLIPFMPFDGSKIFAWNKIVYGIAAGIVLLLFISTFLI